MHPFKTREGIWVSPRHTSESRSWEAIRPFPWHWLGAYSIIEFKMVEAAGVEPASLSVSTQSPRSQAWLAFLCCCKLNIQFHLFVSEYSANCSLWIWITFSVFADVVLAFPYLRLRGKGQLMLRQPVDAQRSCEPQPCGLPPSWKDWSGQADH